MEENTKSFEFLNKLALISEASSNTVNGKISVIYEVKKDEYVKIYNLFNSDYDETKTQFKVDISGSDFIFVLDEL
jgi:hypothetical protein